MTTQERAELLRDIDCVGERSANWWLLQMLTRCRDALAAAVPREPTEAMLLAGAREYRLPNNSSAAYADAMWRAMWDAAQVPLPTDTKEPQA